MLKGMGISDGIGLGIAVVLKNTLHHYQETGYEKSIGKIAKN